MKLRNLFLSLALVVPYQNLFLQYDGARWVDRASQIRAESAYNPNAKSYIINKQGMRVPCAWGLSQFTMDTWRIWGKPKGVSPLDPEAAISANSRYMLWLEARSAKLDPANTWDGALAGYNAGIGNYEQAIWLSEQLGGNMTWQQTLPNITHANAQQTIDYVKRIHQYKNEIQAKLGKS